MNMNIITEKEIPEFNVHSTWATYIKPYDHILWHEKKSVWPHGHDHKFT